MTIGTEYGRLALEALPDDQRRTRLASLARLLTQRLAGLTDWNAYWESVAIVIEELRSLGHDLWRHDFDSEGRELWGWDYTRRDGIGFLQVHFRFKGEVHTHWRTENPRLGVDNDADEPD